MAEDEAMGGRHWLGCELESFCCLGQVNVVSDLCLHHLIQDRTWTVVEAQFQ